MSSMWTGYSSCAPPVTRRQIRNAGTLALLGNSSVGRLHVAIGRGGSGHDPVEERVEHPLDDEVIVHEGLCGGVRAIVRQFREKKQLLIRLFTIGRGVTVTIGTAAVRPTAVE